MEEKKFDIIPVGTRIRMKKNRERTGTVVIQSETKGICLIKMDAYANDQYTALGLFREPRGIWLEPEEIEVIEAPEAECVPDMRKNWTLVFTSTNGVINYMWRIEKERYNHGWINVPNLSPAKAVREWAYGIEKENVYAKIFGDDA